MSIRRLKRWVHRKLDDRSRGPARPKRLFRAMQAPFVRFWRTVNRARKKRKFRNLWLGLPAIIVGGLLAAAAVAANFGRNDLRQTYRGLAVNSYKRGEFGEARIYLERLYRAGERSDEIRFFLATTLSALGEGERASAMIDSLAPEDREGRGYADAHFVKAKVLVASSPFDPDRTFHHLNGAKPKYGDDADWLYMMSEVYGRVEDTESAIFYLRRAARIDPWRAYDLSQKYIELGRRGDAAPHLATARQYFEKVLAGYKAENVAYDATAVRAMLDLGSVLRDQGQFDLAFKVLREGLALKPDGRFGKALAEVCLAQYARLGAENKGPPAERLRCLQMALEYDKSCGNAARLLVKFGEEVNDPAARQQANDFLETMIALGDQSSPAAHLALGSKAWARGELDTAKFHLKRAYGLDSRMAITANNLAWVLGHEADPKSVSDGLGIINVLLEDYPEVADFRDTRGHILANQEKWAEALVDFEFVLRANPRDPELHAALKQVYSNLNPPQEGLAKKHGQIERSLRSRESIQKK